MKIEGSSQPRVCGDFSAKALSLSFRLCSVRNWIASFADLLLLPYRWTPFCAVSGLDPPKGARRHLSTDCHLFPTAGPPFCAVSGLELPKRVQWHLTSGLLPFPAAWNPFLCRQRLGSSKKGSCDLASKFAFGATFSAALPQQRRCTCVRSLSVPSSASCRCSVCGSCCLDMPPLFHNLQSIPFIPGLPSSVGRAQGPELEFRLCSGKLD